MNDDKYPEEVLGEEDDDGTMPGNVDDLRKAVVGHKIVKAVTYEKKRRWSGAERALTLTLDDGREVELVGGDDCCAYTELQAFWADPSLTDHAIAGVGTTGGYTTWHIYADFGDLMRLQVGWSAGNPFYYGYGFDITVKEPGDE